MNEFVLSVENPPIPDFKNKAKELQPKVAKTFDMTQAVPSFPTFDVIRKELIKDLDNPEMSFYTEVPGLIELRKLLADEHVLKSKFTHENVLITVGANHAAYTALTLLLNHGDGILLPEPFYFNHDMAVKMLGLKANSFSFRAEDSFQLKADLTIEELEKTQSKAIVLVTPNNPTGAFYKSSEILKLLDWTSKRKVQVILDETYIHFDEKHLNDSRIGDFISKNLTLVGSFSKSFSLTGYRVGYLIADERVMLQALKVQDTMVICAPAISQRAALHGLKLCKSELKQKVNELLELTQILREKSKDWKHFKLLSSGAFFAFIGHPYEELSSREAALKLYEESGVLSLPGNAFGSSQGAFLRLAYANFDATSLRQALDQISAIDKQM